LWKLIAELYIPGPPIAQPRPRLAKRGRFAHAYVPQNHPVHEYRRQIAETAKETKLFFKGPVSIYFEFVFQRPKSHWTKTGLRKGAPQFPPGKDCDNVQKAVQDALNEVIYNDDSQITEWSGRRYYSSDREHAGHTLVKVDNAKKRSG
jgi:Holliday junction resolvase RusA-like endonuclease